MTKHYSASLFEPARNSRSICCMRPVIDINNNNTSNNNSNSYSNSIRQIILSASFRNERRRASSLSVSVLAALMLCFRTHANNNATLCVAKGQA